MSTRPTIRKSMDGDIAAITELLAMLNREEGYELSANVQDITGLLAGDRVKAEALVVEREGTIIGTVLYYWGYDTVSASYGYHLADIVVVQEQRGQGIGRALFATLAAQCLHEDGQWISLTVLKKNPRAQRFYQRLGMVEVAVDFYAIGPKGLAKCSEALSN